MCPVQAADTFKKRRVPIQRQKPKTQETKVGLSGSEKSENQTQKLSPKPFTPVSFSESAVQKGSPRPVVLGKRSRDLWKIMGREVSPG